MRDWEKATWASGQTESAVIRQVGQRLAVRALQLTQPGDSILLLAGKGHNGDDVRAAKDLLSDRKVHLLDLLSPETDIPALELALRQRPALVVDGIFGIGVNRPLTKAWQKIIATVNAAHLPVLAVDVPSGLNADTGEPMGAAIQATVTLTVGAPKTGLLTANAWQFIGRVEVAGDVGLIPCSLKSEHRWLLPEDFKHFPPGRPVAAHKGSFGHVAILAGSLGYHGAAVLATRGAQRAQPGLATVFPQENVYSVIAPQLQSAMVTIWTPETEFPKSVTSLLVGPGLKAPGVADSLHRILYRWWRDFEHPVVVDASGLDVLATGPSSKEFPRVLTPHPGEAARMLNWTTQKVQSNRPAAVRELSKRYGDCWVVLKGYQTLIGHQEGELFVNSSGNPYLAQGGSGDLLSGYLAGLLAQPPLLTDVATTLCYAVWQHGAAADKLQATRSNWTIEDLANELGNAP